MKLYPPSNPNYAATIVQIKVLLPLKGLDNLVAAPLLGYQAIVSKDVQVGDWGVLFTAETQLSPAFASANNLHRHGNLNNDQSATGYLEDNRRVKAIRLRGHRSDALFLHLDSLSSFVDGPGQFSVGDTFDQLNGTEICRKYMRPTTGRGAMQAKIEKVTRVDKKFLPEHFDTASLFRNEELLTPGERVVITQKLHGTSIRIGHALVNRKLTWKERLAKRFGVKVQETEYDYVYGSRKVIKDPNNSEQNHFYGTDLWTEEGAKLFGLLPKGTVVYGELIGWASHDSQIQAKYTYGLAPGKRELYVYRITQVNPDGQTIDLSWDAIREFCRNTGLRSVPELSREPFTSAEHITEKFLDRRLVETYIEALPVDKKLVDEGVCIRREGITPLILKAKSPIFLQHETKMLDQEVTDIEADDDAS